MLARGTQRDTDQLLKKHVDYIVEQELAMFPYTLALEEIQYMSCTRVCL